MSTTTKPTLRPFEDMDWQSFAGCESETPEIACSEGHHENEWVLILDGDTIQIHAGDGETTYGAGFPSERSARIVAEAILGALDRDDASPGWVADQYGLTEL